METAGVPAPVREQPAFDTPNILWFFGAFTAAGASDAVIAQVHHSARGVWILLVSLAFLAASRPGPGTHANAFIVLGGAMIVVGLALDAASARRAAFWWHLVGLTALATGLGYYAFRHASWGWVLIFVAGSGFLLFATVLIRGTWAVFGVAGFYAPIAHYLDVWLGRLGTTFALAAVGIGLVALGVATRR